MSVLKDTTPTPSTASDGATTLRSTSKKTNMPPQEKLVKRTLFKVDQESGRM
jgi:hypothetical protein